MTAYTTHITLLGKLGEDANPAAWNEFCDRYGELIRSFARRQGLQASDCDDVLQDVLVALAGSMSRFEYDPDKGKFRSYLKTITLRAIYKKFRQKQQPSRQEPIGDGVLNATSDPETDERWEQEWRQHHLRQAMRTIDTEFSDADRAAFRLYALGGRGAKETAEALGMSVDRVYQAKSRIMNRLGALVETQVQDEG
ncbi:MAG: sigma-70 family RNA polymerase sigma factor [Phycisphaerales bacterium JB059]